MWANCFEITLELSCCKYPPTSELQQEWENNRESLLTFIEKVVGAEAGCGATSGSALCPRRAESTAFRCSCSLVHCMQ